MHFVADFIGQQFPALPIVFGHAIFDRDNRVIGAKLGQIVGVFGRCQRFAFAHHLVFAAPVIFGRGTIKRQINILARHIARFFDRCQNQIQRRAGAFQIGGKAAFIAQARVMARRGQLFFQGVKHFRAHAHRLADIAGRYRHDHKLLNINGVIGVFAAIDDIHHRHRQHPGRGAPHVAKQRLCGVISGRLGAGQRHAQNGVCPKARFIGRAVKFDHRHVDGHLFGHVKAHQRLGNLAIHGRNRLQHALAHVARRVAIAHFHRFMRPG